SMDYMGKRPWDSRRIEGSVNLDAQSNGLNAIYQQFWKEDWFAGGFVWKWFANYEQAGGRNNNRFTPQNKPAEQVLKQLFGTKK
ncbi:MAG: glycoside hydrolase, partial [Flavobacteriales bacterium]|nr:glycoside hydrolase [Flavobacteriales bacterium]